MRHHRGTAIGFAVLAAFALTATASGGPAASKQRVAFEGRLHLASGKGTWRMIPLSSGPLRRDSGTLVGGGTFKNLIKRNGQKVVVVIGKDSHTGRNGTFEITQRLETVNVAAYHIGHGTWSFKAGTGDYAGVSGGGGYADAATQNTGVLYSRQEGYLTKR